MAIERMIDTQNGGCWILEIHDLGPSPLEGKRVGFEITRCRARRAIRRTRSTRRRGSSSARAAASLSSIGW
jgi:hypothetical protein